MKTDQQEIPELAADDLDARAQGRRKFLFGGGAAIAAYPLLAGKANATCNPLPPTAPIKVFATIDDMLCASTAGSIGWFEICEVEGGWSPGLPACPGKFLYLGTLSGAPIADQGVLIEASGNYWLRLLEGNPCLSMWKNTAGYWDAAFANARRYLMGVFDVDTNGQLYRSEDPVQSWIKENMYGPWSIRQVLEFDAIDHEFSDTLTIRGWNFTALSLRGKTLNGSTTRLKFSASASTGVLIKAFKDDEGDALTQYDLSNLIIEGVSHTTANACGLLISGGTVVMINNCKVTGFTGAGANQVKIQNAFTLKWQGGEIRPVETGNAGGHALVIESVVSSSNSSWVNSNIEFINTRISNAGGVGAYVGLIATTFDNLRFDNVEFVDNQGGNFQCTEKGLEKLNVISNLRFSGNCLFRGTTADANVPFHIKVRGICGMAVRGCNFSYADNHIVIESTQGFSIDGNFFNASGSTMLLTVDAGYEDGKYARSYGRVVNNTGLTSANLSLSDDSGYPITAANRIQEVNNNA